MNPFHAYMRKEAKTGPELAAMEAERQKAAVAYEQREQTKADAGRAQTQAGNANKPVLPAVKPAAPVPQPKPVVATNNPVDRISQSLAERKSLLSE